MGRRKVSENLLARITASAEATGDAKEAFLIRIEARDALIVEAVESGIQQREIAEAAQISPGRITQLILASEVHRSVN